jgi:phosphotransferase system enzyme I (PtsP)
LLNILQRISQDISSARDLRATLDMVVLSLLEMMVSDACSIFLWDSESRRFVLSANQGFAAHNIGNLSLNAGEGIIALVGKREEPINLADAAHHPSFHFVQGIGEEAYHGMLAVPIIHQRKLLGVIMVQKKAKIAYASADEALLVTISAQLSAAIAHAKASGYLGRDFFGHTLLNNIYRGVVGSSGVAIGTAYMGKANANLDSIGHRDTDDIDGEITLFETALANVRLDMTEVGNHFARDLRPEERAIFDVYLRMLDDAALGQEVIQEIAKGQWAQGALATVVKRYSKHFESMEDPYIRERATDIRDMGRRILSYLQAEDTHIGTFPERAVIIGEELTPAILAEIPENHIAALVSIKGSANSHIAIFARAMGIPTVMGVTDFPYQNLLGQELVVDGYRGKVLSNLTNEKKQHYRDIIAEERALVQGLDNLIPKPCTTLDGVTHQLLVNTGLMTDVVRALDRGAEGVGLYRTEIPFMMRDRFPSEFEQTEIYRQQLKIFHPRDVVMRTLDIGGDKALSYFPINEQNPFLGWRGIRVTLDHPEIFMVQLRAMLRASEGLNNLKILLPMVTNNSEIDEAMHLLYRAMHELQEEGIEVQQPKVGMMVEIPANVYQIASVAHHVDFLSVGSNDLTQYLLAVDRTNPRVAGMFDSFHPGVLRALQLIVDEAKAADIEVSICGEIAGDPIGAIILSAMGYRNLSMSSTSLLKVKSVLRQISHSWAVELLRDVTKLDDPRVVRATIELALQSQDISLSKLGISKFAHDG